jgi:delta14-sterol reductase/lamin-B receptor
VASPAPSPRAKSPAKPKPRAKKAAAEPAPLVASPAKATKTASPAKTAASSAKVAASPVKPAAAAPAVAAVKHEQPSYEFGGPLGAVGIIVGLPVLTYALFHLANGQRHLTWKVSEFDWAGAFAALPHSMAEFTSTFVTREAAIMFFGWMAFQVLLERVLPGDDAQGVELDEGRGRLTYTMSGHLQLWISVLAMGHFLPKFSVDAVTQAVSFQGLGRMPLEMIYTHFASLMFFACAFSLVLAIFLYVKSFSKGAQLAKGGNTGNALYDFFIGRELNPRIGSLDLKQFCELRPGLIGWLVINLGMATQQYLVNRSVSGSMLLVVLFQGFYVWDALYQERAILTTMDITTDGFGFMLAFGDLAWVPFIYTIQARYLVDHDPKLSLPALVAIAAVHFLGYWIFRSANGQKDDFRRDPEAANVKHLTFLATKRGTKLLTSGWWGAARKINYTGDWLITLSWCLLCGFNSPIPYFQAIYFAILLVHRALRDDHMCHLKYGDDWLEYKKRVPYMFIPRIF